MNNSPNHLFFLFLNTPGFIQLDGTSPLKPAIIFSAAMTATLVLDSVVAEAECG